MLTGKARNSCDEIVAKRDLRSYHRPGKMAEARWSDEASRRSREMPEKLRTRSPSPAPDAARRSRHVGDDRTVLQQCGRRSPQQITKRMRRSPLNRACKTFLLDPTQTKQTRKAVRAQVFTSAVHTYGHTRSVQRLGEPITSGYIRVTRSIPDQYIRTFVELLIAWRATCKSSL